jgi:hypothetical protein
MGDIEGVTRHLIAYKYLQSSNSEQGLSAFGYWVVGTAQVATPGPDLQRHTYAPCQHSTKPVRHWTPANHLHTQCFECYGEPF